MACPVKVAQLQSELDWIVEIYKQKKPGRVLEIGSLYGGTLWHWMMNSEPGTLIVSLDYTIYTEPKKVALIRKCKQDWPAWAASRGLRFKEIYGDSTLPATAAKVAKYAPFDFVFVDGGHLVRVVNSDFETYWTMVAPGGLMAFHDIGYQEGHPRSQPVGKWWQDVIQPMPLKRTERVDLPGMWGIGVLEK